MFEKKKFPDVDQKRCTSGDRPSSGAAEDVGVRRAQNIISLLKIIVIIISDICAVARSP